MGKPLMSSVPDSRPRTLALIHTVSGLIQPLEALAKRHLPDWDSFNMLDESLLRGTIRDGQLTVETMRRLTGMVWSAVDAGARAVVVTCSSLGPAVEIARRICPVPVFRIDEGMALEAIRLGPRIGVLATLPTTLQPTSALIERLAAERGLSCTLACQVVDDAFARLSTGDTEGHDRRVAEAITTLGPQVDVIVLAQASMARALLRARDELGSLPVLTSPELGMAFIAGSLAG
jgi:Asp/Glu/hydantoin racemase